MKKQLRYLSLICTFALAVACFAGCGTGGNSAQSAEQSTSQSAPSSTSEAQAGPITKDEAVTESAAAYRDVINVGINADPGDLSPWGPNSTGRTATTDAIYQTLAICENGEIYGVLMKDYTLADDESYMDVTLYDSIHDSEGNPLTAKDVVFSFEKCIEGGNVNGLSYISGTEALDDYTVRFNFGATLYVYDLETLFETFYIVTQAAYEASADGMASMPVTTYPYKVTKYTSGYILTMEKVDDYWQKDESAIHNRHKTNVQTINYYIITETSQMTMALENGSIDMSWAVSTDDLYVFQEGGGQSTNYWVHQTPDNLVMQFFANCSDDKATSNVDLRKALYYAVDSNVVLQSVYNGAGIVTYDTGRPKCPDYQTTWESEDNYYHYDLDKSKEHFAAAGYKEGELTLKLMCESTETTSNLAVLVQSFLSQIGVKVEIEAVQPSLLTTYSQDPTAWDLYLTSKSASNYITTNWKNCFSASYFSWDGTINFANDDELQTKLDAARLLSTHSDETVQAVHDHLIENAYGRGLVNYYLNYVVPNNCSQIVLSHKNAILPGACTYTA